MFTSAKPSGCALIFKNNCFGFQGEAISLKTLEP